jgi:hypothetical protein
MSNIEKKGVVARVTGSEQNFEPYFKENDRTPSWDSIFVYDRLIKKENLKDNLQVQIKSTGSKALI